jgi:ankyrin repeat protein
MNCGNNYSGTHSPTAGWAGAPSSPDPDHMRDVLSTSPLGDAGFSARFPMAMPRFGTVVRPTALPLQDYDDGTQTEALCRNEAVHGASHNADFYFLTAETRLTSGQEAGSISRSGAPDSPRALTEPGVLKKYHTRAASLASGGDPKSCVVPDSPRVRTRQSARYLEMVAAKRKREPEANDATRDAKRFYRDPKIFGQFSEVPLERLRMADLPTASTTRSTTRSTTTSTTTSPRAPGRAAPASPESRRELPALSVPGNSSASRGRVLSFDTINKNLIQAVYAEEVAVLAFLIDNYHPNLDAALLLAARYGRAKSMQLLLQRGANIHAADRAGGTPLVWAITKGHCDVAGLILAHAPDELHRCGNSVGVTNLHYAIHGGSSEMVAALLQRGADPNAIEHRGYNALHLAMLVTSAFSNGIVSALIKFKVNTKALTTRGETFLLLAAASRIGVIPPTLEPAAREVLNIPDSAGRTPLTWACMVGNGTIARHLIDLGADQKVKGPGGKTARECAEESRNMDLVALLD